MLISGAAAHDATTAEWSVAHATWFLVLATALAFIAAGVAAWYVGRTFHKERDRDRRAQAVTVAAWWSAGDQPKTWTKSVLADDAIRVGNLSDLPIYDVEVIAEFENGAGNVMRIRRLPVVAPTDREGVPVHIYSPEVTWLEARWPDNKVGPVGRRKTVPPRVWIQFRDATSEGWARHRDGRLGNVRQDFDEWERYTRLGDKLLPDESSKRLGEDEP